MKRGKKRFNISNRLLYTFIILGILTVVSVGVYAATYTASGAGHPYTEISTCSANQILQMNSAGTAWTCAAAGGSSQWATSGSNIYYSTGNVGIGTASPLSKLSVGQGSIANTAIWGNGSAYGVVGITDATTSNGVGVYGRSNGATGTGVIGLSTVGTGTGGYFSSASGYALLTGTGNVGIGTNTPTQKLDVNGNVKGSGFCIGTSCITSWPSISKGPGIYDCTANYCTCGGSCTNPITYSSTCSCSYATTAYDGNPYCGAGVRTVTIDCTLKGYLVN